MIAVKFTASEPEKAAQIANKLIRIYWQEVARASDGGSSQTQSLRESFQSLGPSAYLISEAVPPIRADGPPPGLVIAGAVLLGMGIAAALALLLDAINDTIRDSRQIEYALGLDCLCIIRDCADVDGVGSGSGELLCISQDQALCRMTATMLDASLHGLRTFGVTSAVSGEGVTTLAVALAQALAVSGKRLLLIDGCPENPSLSRWTSGAPRLPVWSREGFRCGVVENLVEVQERLHVLRLAERAACETSPLCSVTLNDILRSVTEIYDFVIVDMPALAAGPDVRATAQALDAFLLVVKWGSTESELVRQALHSAGEARSKFIGAMLNKADEKVTRQYEKGFCGR
jgi:Mrp family chromosome partitioning ATPase